MRRHLSLVTFIFAILLASRGLTATSVYGVVPPLFGPKKLASVTERLDHLQNLGVDVLWIAPVMQTDDPSHISYSITDYEKIRPDFGTERDLKILVSKAHARGMKVILDFVPNHSSVRHPWFTDDRSSASWSLHHRDSEGNPTHYFDWVHLPNLNYDDPRIPKYMTEVMLDWIDRFSVDGFRFDAAWGVTERAPWFWSRAIEELRARSPGVFNLAEASARDPVYRESGFDLAYDWTDSLGEWAWKKAFDDLPRVATHLADALSGDPRDMKRTLRFLNNNDTRERFITRHGREITKVATVLTYTVPGVPLLFTGDEFGAEYEPYDDIPPLEWQDTHALIDLHRRLAKLRRSEPALRDGTFRILGVDGSESVFSFVRTSGRSKIWTILNFGPSTTVTLEAPRGVKSWREALGGKKLHFKRAGGDRVVVTLPRRSAFVARPR